MWCSILSLSVFFCYCYGYCCWFWLLLLMFVSVFPSFFHPPLPSFHLFFIPFATSLQYPHRWPASTAKKTCPGCSWNRTCTSYGICRNGKCLSRKLHGTPSFVSEPLYYSSWGRLWHDERLWGQGYSRFLWEMENGKLMLRGGLFWSQVFGG